VGVRDRYAQELVAKTRATQQLAVSEAARDTTKRSLETLRAETDALRKALTQEKVSTVSF
jgi:hypothetical protein